MKFQSTLPRGERPSPSRTTTRRCNFNPRSHEGSDVVVINGFSVNQVISIHAPTRGATRDTETKIKEIKISIHAPTRGATSRSEDVALTAGFQSTLPRGERQTPYHYHRLLFYFNPRSHEGSDSLKFIRLLLFLHISIHAPTRGAT